MVLTYTALVFISGVCLAWAVLSHRGFYAWTHSPDRRSFMINVIAGLLLLLLTGGYAWHAVSSGAVTGPPPPTPTPSASVPSTSPTPSTGGPTTSNSLDLPVTFVGTWRGTAHVTGPRLLVHPQ